MKKTLIAFILDRSGSMDYIKNDAIGGFNSFIAEQKTLPDPADFTLATFATDYTIVHNAIPLQDVPDLSAKTFKPQGGPALNDAIGRTIATIREQGAEYETVIIAILTDGEENASREFTASHVKDMIENQQSKGWTILYLGANQDATKVGMSMGVSGQNTMSYDATPKGVTNAYANMSSSILRTRASAT